MNNRYCNSIRLAWILAMLCCLGGCISPSYEQVAQLVHQAVLEGRVPDVPESGRSSFKLCPYKGIVFATTIHFAQNRNRYLMAASWDNEQGMCVQEMWSPEYEYRDGAWRVSLIYYSPKRYPANCLIHEVVDTPGR